MILLSNTPFTTDKEPGIYFTNSNVGYSLKNYLKKLKAKTAIIEKYVDKDYLIDYQHFYCRSFKKYDRFTKRIHFFSYQFNDEQFKTFLNKGNDKELRESYLGFIVIKPGKGKTKPYLIGRTLLKKYPDLKKSEGELIYKKYDISLFGFSLEVNTLPFQTQDEGVGGCATIALWIALNPLSGRFNIKQYSPSEITEISTTFPSPLRIFPSSGLTWEQMITCIRSIGLDLEVINVGGINDNGKMFSIAVQAYVKNNIPLIGKVSLKKGTEKPEYHAIVISGYRCDKNGQIVEIFMHDDQLGLYTSTTPERAFKSWKNDWNLKGYEFKIENLMIPIYHKIRTTFARIYSIFKTIDENLKDKDDEIDCNLLLTTTQSYKDSLLKEKILNKEEKLLTFIPKFL